MRAPRVHHAARRRGGGVAARGARAAGRARAAHRGADKRAVRRAGIAGPHRGVPARTAGSGLVGRAQRADRHSLGRRAMRAPSQIRGGTGRARPGRHPGRRRRDQVAAATGDPHRADRVRAGPRSGRHRLRRSLARPGGNTTGFLQFEYGLSGKWLGLLREIAPEVKRVGVLRDLAAVPPGSDNGPSSRPASPMGVELNPVHARYGRRDRARRRRLRARSERRPDRGSGYVATLHRDLIVALAARHKLPAIYPYRFFVEAAA